MKWLITALAFIGIIAAGCSTSFITSSWKSDSIPAPSYKKILVLGLIGDPDRAVREKMEEHIAGDLRDLGYSATCACQEYEPKTFAGMNENQAVEKIMNDGYDAVVTVVLLNKTKERVYAPGRIEPGSQAGQQQRFWQYYSSTYDRVYQAGYYSIETNYFWETNLYDLKSSSLVYSAQSQSFDPESSDKLGHEYGIMIVKDMVKKEVLIKKEKETPKAF
jgi:hypothetical protein